jgi:hypothetical protein
LLNERELRREFQRVNAPLLQSFSISSHVKTTHFEIARYDLC